MQDTKKTKKQLIQELVALRQRLSDGTVRIAIRTQVVAEQPEVVIHDTGHGIAPSTYRTFLTRSIRHGTS